MRKSQAPSIKVKPFLTTTESKNTTFQSNSISLENNLECKRSTESVLNLLSSLDKPSLKNNVTINTFCNESSSDTGFTKTNEGDNSFSPIQENQFLNKYQQPNLCLKVFNVVYGKQTKKKHKTWEGDGILEVGSKYLVLKDENGTVISKAPLPKARKLEEGERFYLGNKEVELLDLAINSIDVFEQTKESECLASDSKNKLSAARKPLIHCKRFQHPRSCYSSGITLPEPNADHQWHFNQKGLPLSQVYFEETLSKKLRPHQLEGITFLYECIMGFKNINQMGAILADEMGLGKTLQCIALIWILLKQGPYGNIPVIKKALIVAPSSLTMNWYNEFIKWLGRVKLVPFVVSQKDKPCNMRGPVMIISYEMFVRYIDDIVEHKFDLLICDEGHRLKNSNIKTTQMLNRINCMRRIILTGTPLQNDLQEFYTLVDFVNPNSLGTSAQFRCLYVEPILASRQPNANEDVVNKGKKCAQDLKNITSKFLLRRTRDILKDYLPPKHDIVVFCKITALQKTLYNSLIDSFLRAKENSLNFWEGSSCLELITTLKKVCNHPSLISKEYVEEFSVIDVSGKVKVAVNFLRELKTTSPKEKVVLVSNSTQTLDLLEKILQTLNYTTCRLDGSTPTALRNKVVEQFNCSFNNAFVFLLSSKAGGVGLNVTGASRLILFDSDWNPATDLQAISRIWRDGQKYSVYIYRFLTTGTIEEKIYQRQLSKMGLYDGTVDPENNKSIKLSQEELKDIFFLCEDELEDCLTHRALYCDCTKKGEIPVPEIEEEERSCQLMKFSNAALKISELFHWEHHGHPFNLDFLTELCLKNSEEEISFIFRNGKC